MRPVVNTTGPSTPGSYQRFRAGDMSVTPRLAAIRLFAIRSATGSTIRARWATRCSFVRIRTSRRALNVQMG